MRLHSIVLVSLLACALAAPAWAQSAKGAADKASGAAAGKASGGGDYGLSSSYGGSAGIGLSGTSSAYSTGKANAGTSSYGLQGGGLPQGMSALPSIDSSGTSGSASGSGARPAMRINRPPGP